MLDQITALRERPAKDFERAKRWYAGEARPDARHVDMGPRRAVYAPGGVTFLLYQTEFAGTGKHTIATFVVDDIDQGDGRSCAPMASSSRTTRWATRARTPSTVSTVTTAAAWRAAWFKDSEDNILALTQLPPGMEIPKPGQLIGGHATARSSTAS